LIKMVDERLKRSYEQIITEETERFKNAIKEEMLGVCDPIDDKSDIIADLYMMMNDIAERGKKYAEEFKKVNGEHWKEDDCHGYVQSFLDSDFHFG